MIFIAWLEKPTEVNFCKRIGWDIESKALERSRKAVVVNLLSSIVVLTTSANDRRASWVL